MHAIFYDKLCEISNALWKRDKSELQCPLVYKSITSELLSIELHHKKSASIIIPAFYRPLNCASAEFTKCVVYELHIIYINHPNCQLWVYRYFNLPELSYNQILPISLKCVLEFLKLPFYCDLEQMVNMPSRGNSIDLLFTTHPSLIDKCVSIPGVGDHDAVLLHISTSPQCNKPIK